MNQKALLESGMDAFNNGDYPGAVNLLQQALRELRQADKPQELGLCIYTLESASAFIDDRELDKEALEEALRLFQQTELHYHAASCCICLARIVVAETPLEAKRFLDTARNHYKQCENWTGAARVSRLEAQFARDRGEQDAALKLLNEALRLINEQPQGLESVKAEKRQIEKLRSKL